MTVQEHVAEVEQRYVNRVWRPRAENAARSAVSALGAARIINLLVAVPSKRQYRKTLGRQDQAATVDRRVVRRMRRDVSVLRAMEIARGWGPRLAEYALRRQADEYAGAVLVRAVAYDAATDARVRVRVTAAELAIARGMLIVGRTIRELLVAAARRLAERLRSIPLEAESSASRRKSTLEPAIRKATNGALARFFREAAMLMTDYWYAAVQVAWSRPLAVRSVRR